MVSLIYIAVSFAVHFPVLCLRFCSSPTFLFPHLPPPPHPSPSTVQVQEAGISLYGPRTQNLNLPISAVIIWNPNEPKL